jgi:hypothetical protein
MRLSAIGHNVLGFVPHAKDDIPHRFFILRARSRNILATITQLDLLQCRYLSYETCAKEM